VADKKDDAEDLDFFIGNDATVKRPNYNVDYPIRDGVVNNWDNMEKYLQRCIYQHLRADPEEHYFLMTEPPLNSPENREYTAEIMFETFNVPGLYIAVQAVLALCASKISTKGSRSTSEVTGTVIDSGDGVTHIVPVVSGYVIGSCIKHIPLAGRTITDFVAEQLRARGEPVPPDQILDVSRRIKEMHCYVSPDLVKEYNKYDQQPDKFFLQYEGADIKTKKPFTVDIGYERFLGPELFFNPEIFSSDFSTPLPDLVDQVIQACPIDTRKNLYSYITLSGGSTMYKNFTRRIERDLTKKVKERHDKNVQLFPDMDLKMMDVNVVTHAFQRFAVWFGGSMLAAQPDVIKSFHTRADYQEHGPRIARTNPVFQSL
jgi:actin-related protein 3